MRKLLTVSIPHSLPLLNHSITDPNISNIFGLRDTLTVDPLQIDLSHCLGCHYLGPFHGFLSPILFLFSGRVNKGGWFGVIGGFGSIREGERLRW